LGLIPTPKKEEKTKNNEFRACSPATMQLAKNKVYLENPQNFGN
jgi:hypothetical protein